MSEQEMCGECDCPTGNAGVGDDSLYMDDGRGPLCGDCHNLFTLQETVAAQQEQLAKVEAERDRLHSLKCDVGLALGDCGDEEALFVDRIRVIRDQLAAKDKRIEALEEVAKLSALFLDDFSGPRSDKIRELINKLEEKP